MRHQVEEMRIGDRAAHRQEIVRDVVDEGDRAPARAAQAEDRRPLCRLCRKQRIRKAEPVEEPATGIAVAMSLFLFNVGVEIGQLAFIGVAVLAILGLRWLRAQAPWNLATPARLAPAYAIGGLASFWFIERLALVVQ